MITAAKLAPGSSRDGRRPTTSDGTGGRDTPQPVRTAADLRVEIHPDAAAVDIRGDYQLVNRTGMALRERLTS